MTVNRALSAADRDFFTLVQRAIHANPFGREREEIDLQLAGLPSGAPAEERLSRAVALVRERLAGLAKRGADRLACYAGEDRQLLQNGCLFDFFYRYLDDFDRLILDQARAGDPPLPVGFAAEAMGQLYRFCHSAEEARFYFALCFQLRRAFYFIHASLAGRSPCMRQLRLDLWNNVFTCDLGLYARYLWNRMEDFSTLILGETGSGKGAAAAAIGRSGHIPFDEAKGCFRENFTRTFVAINLSQFSESLIESELFGHKKGAFTGAVEDHQGLLDRCSPFGAVFLDEIGEVPAPIQIKLLQVLQERTFSPVGSHARRRFAGRVVAATNRPIRELLEKGYFRQDFYYRLCADTILVPPLRQRLAEDPGELEDLLAVTVNRLVGFPSPELVALTGGEIRRQLGDGYPWPGNVRELEQCVRRLLLKRSYGGVSSPPADASGRLASGIERGELTAAELLAAYCALLYQHLGSYGEVARRTGLDWRTVKKHIEGRC